MKAPGIVANSSPIIALERVDCLDLFPALYEQVVIPPAVRIEVFANNPLSDWIEQVSLQQPLAPQIVAARLGSGESEAVTLALEIKAQELVLDDLPARRLALSLGLPVIGVLGLLLRAKEHGLISQIKPIMEALQVQGFRISERLFVGFLKACGEYDG